MGPLLKSEPIRLCIAGSRTFDDYNQLVLEAKTFIVEEIKTRNIIIVSGTARGADSLGEDFGKQFGMTIEEYPADWDQFGKSAGYIRNKEMAQVSDYALIFWDGKSKGTKHMIDLCNAFNVKIKIITY